MDAMDIVDGVDKGNDSTFCLCPYRSSLPLNPGLFLHVRRMMEFGWMPG